MATGWTGYHDVLMQEMIALMTEPEWYTSTDITTRLAEIRAELEDAGASLGQVPILDASGQPQYDADGNLITESQNEAMQRLFSEIEQGRLQAIAQNEQRYADLLSGYDERMRTALDQYFAPVAEGFQQRATQSRADLDQIAGRYAQREQDALGLLSGLGDQARADLQRQYMQRNAQSENDLINRGLANSTVLNSTRTGLDQAESQDRQRLEEGLRREQLGYMTGLRGESLQAQQQAAMAGAQYGLESLGFGSTLGGTYAQLAGDRFGVMERRTDIAPNLSDVANIGMQLGRGSSQTFALPNFGSPTTYQQPQQP